MFTDAEFEVTAVEPVNDRVVATVIIRTRTGDMHIEHEWGYLVEVRDGRVQALTAFHDPSGARAAVREQF